MNKKKITLCMIGLCMCAAILMTGCGRYSFLRQNPFIDKISSEEKEEGEAGPFDMPAYLKTAERPDGFSGEVLGYIKELEPAEPDMIMNSENLEEKNIEEMECPKNPYEILVSGPNDYYNATVTMLERYFASYLYEDTETIDEPDIPGEKEFSYVEVQHGQILAGDAEKFAVAAAVKIHDVNTDHTIYTQFGEMGNDKAVHCNLTVYAERATDYSYVMKGICDTEEACGVIEEKFQPVYAEALPVSSNTCRIENETLSVTCDGGKEWNSVPVTMEKLFWPEEYGGQTMPAEGSYYISLEHTFFVYGGTEALGDKPKLPVKLLLSGDSGKTWKTKELSDAEAVRCFYAGMSADKKIMYVLMCRDKTMGVEGTTLLISPDKGVTWEDMGSANNDGSFLVNGMAFFDSKHGITAVTDHEKPTFFFTRDGGLTWDNRQLEAPEEGYSMVYAPQKQGDEYVFYVGQDGYDKLQGVLYKYISRDKGVTWEKEKRVIL